MKKLLFLLIVSFVVFYSCEETDSTPPTITITSPTNGSTVGEMVEITCMSTDDVGVKKVVLWVNGVSTGIEDQSEPYMLTWNTVLLEDGTYTLVVRSHDDSDNITDSVPIVVTVDNTSLSPSQVDFYPVKVQNNTFIISWTKSPDDDFSSYTLYESSTIDMTSQNEIFTSSNQNDTLFTVENIQTGESRFYSLLIRDKVGLETTSRVIEGVGYGLILFMSNYESVGHQIYTMNITGDNLTNLSNNSEMDFNPIWFPDGSNILFLREYSYNNFSSNKIIRMDSDGQNQIVLTDVGDRTYNPNISSDGSKIVYQSLIDGIWDIYRMNHDGTGKQKLTSSDRIVGNPCFSPDDTKIVYSSSMIGDNDSEIFIMDSDGSDKQRLTYSSGHDIIPEFSPDGNQISFYSERDGNYDVYIMNTDGSGLVNISNSQDSNAGKRFSPDGSLIVFGSGSDWDIDREIMLVDLGTMTQNQLTNNQSNNYDPYFTPDGSKIIFSSGMDGDFYELYIMNIDGSDLSRLTYLEGYSFFPSFQP